MRASSISQLRSEWCSNIRADILSGLVAFDGGPGVIKAVEEIARSKVFVDLECDLLNAVPETSAVGALMKSSASLLREAGYKVEIRFESGQPESVIAREIEPEACDLMILRPMVTYEPGI